MYYEIEKKPTSVDIRSILKNIEFLIEISKAEACEAMGHMPLINQQGGAAYAPSKHSPDKMRNSMFLPLMKKLTWGA